MKHIRLAAIACAVAMAIAGCTSAQADKAANEAEQATEQTVAQPGEDHVLTPESDTQFRPGMKPDALTIIDFNATWCPPCKLFAPVFHKASGMYPDAKFYSIDIDEYGETATAFGISAVPTFILISPDGNTKTLVGLTDLINGITEETTDEEAEAILLTNFCKIIDSMK